MIEDHIAAGEAEMAEASGWFDTSRVLFLDIDGVLNNAAVFRDRRFGFAPLDHLCVRLLHEIVRRTRCRIVLSSAWREMDLLERKLEGDGVFEVYGTEGFGSDVLYARHPDRSTVRLDATEYRRGREIEEWLIRHPEVTQYAIVDDETNMLPEQMGWFVVTSFDEGLTEAQAGALIRIFEPGAAVDFSKD